MSSTNRGGQRVDGDYYATPPHVVDAVLARLGPLGGKRILEPSAGIGSIIDRLIHHGADPDDIVAIESDRERHASLTVPHSYWARFEDVMLVGERFDLCVMNPPFTLAEPHIRRAISLLRPGGTCAALVRLSFALCAEKRAAFRAEHPCDLLVLAKRPSFTGNGNDSADYAWALYGDGRGGKFEVIEDVVTDHQRRRRSRAGRAAA